jgi:hypothetical protein
MVSTNSAAANLLNEYSAINVYRALKHAPNPVQWEGGEHTYIGNQITLQFPAGFVQAGNYQLPLSNGLKLTYGQILALGGDFYGLVDQPLVDDPAPPTRFLAAFNSLATADVAAEATTILAIMQIEIDAVNSAINAGKPAVTAYEALGDTLSAKWNRVTGGGVSDYEPWLPAGRYLNLAKTNWDHFSPWSNSVYITAHAAAVAVAIKAGLQNSLDLLQLAYAMNAFADHYLSDMFSSGHMRTPRKQLYTSTKISSAGSLCSRFMHDEDCAQGLQVSNVAGTKWTAFGDKSYFDQENKTNAQICLQAVGRSAADIWTAFQNPKGTNTQIATALELIPICAALIGSRSGPNPPALFIDSNGVQRRTSISDRSTYAWTRYWEALSTLAQLKYADSPVVGKISTTVASNLLIVRENGPTLGMTLLAPATAPPGFAATWTAENICPSQASTWKSGDFDGDGVAELLQIVFVQGRCMLTVWQEAAGTGGYLPEESQDIGLIGTDAIFLCGIFSDSGLQGVAVVQNSDGNLAANKLAVQILELNDGQFKVVAAGATTQVWDPKNTRFDVGSFLGTNLDQVAGFYLKAGQAAQGILLQMVGNQIESMIGGNYPSVLPPLYHMICGDVMGTGVDRMVVFSGISPSAQGAEAITFKLVEGFFQISGTYGTPEEYGYPSPMTLIACDVNDDGRDEIVVVMRGPFEMEVLGAVGESEAMAELSENHLAYPADFALVTNTGPDFQAQIVLVTAVENQKYQTATYSWNGIKEPMLAQNAQLFPMTGALNGAVGVNVLMPVLPE